MRSVVPQAMRRRCDRWHLSPLVMPGPAVEIRVVCATTAGTHN